MGLSHSSISNQNYLVEMVVHIGCLRLGHCCYCRCGRFFCCCSCRCCFTGQLKPAASELQYLLTSKGSFAPATALVVAAISVAAAAGQS